MSTETIPEVLDEKPGDACGVVGIFDPENHEGAAFKAYLALLLLQHRGQEAAGIAVQTDNGPVIRKDVGLVERVFPDSAETLGKWASKSGIAIGHVRYGTVEAKNAFNVAQPVWGKRAKITLGHNGNINNLRSLAAKYNLDPADYDSDSEGMTLLIDQLTAQTGDIHLALDEILPQLEGAFSVVITRGEQLIAARDRNGFRPLSIGLLESGGYVVASEKPALDIVEASFLRDVEEAEIVTIDKSGLKSRLFTEDINPTICAFEYVYVAKPNSNIQGQNVHLTREQMGIWLAKDSPAIADMVVPLPDSGSSSAKGYSKESGIPLEPGVDKNRYVPRTFIQANRLTREQAVFIKVQPNRDIIDGKRLVVVDDSIVEGVTTRTGVRLLRKAGAAEIHLRIASPPYKWPCFFGMDTADINKLLANKYTIEEMRQYLDVDSLAFLSIDRMREILGREICTACWTGDYPSPPPVERREDLARRLIAAALTG